MVFKLLVSAAIAAPVVAALRPSGDDPPSLLLMGAVLLVLGYHRNLLDARGGIPWLRIVLPREELMYVRHSAWGVPLAPARRVRVGLRVRERTASAPLRAYVVESLPASLRWLARKAGL